MYATYNYKVGATAINILADIALILTGTTDKATLSADCVQANTEILTNVSVAGWTLHDAVSATRKIFKAPWHVDNGSGYNYLELDVGTAGYIKSHGWEGWNNGTHVGTNQTYPTPGHQPINITTGGYLYVSAQSGHSCLIYSFANGVWGGSQGGPDALVEYPRRAIWDTTANAYPCMCKVYSQGNQGFISALFSRVVNAAGADVLGGTAIGITGTIFGNMTDLNHVNDSTPATTLPSADKSPRHIFLPIEVFNMGFGFIGGCLSTYGDFYITTRSYGTSLDEVTYNGNTYVVWPAYTSRLAIRKG